MQKLDLKHQKLDLPGFLGSGGDWKSAQNKSLVSQCILQETQVEKCIGRIVVIGPCKGISINVIKITVLYSRINYCRFLGLAVTPPFFLITMQAVFIMLLGW